MKTLRSTSERTKRLTRKKGSIQSNKKIALNTNELKNKKVGNNSEENTDSLNLDDLSREHILQCISAIFHLTEEQLKNKNALFDGESNPIFMQVTCIKVPKTPKRCMRM